AVCAAAGAEVSAGHPTGRERSRARPAAVPARATVPTDLLEQSVLIAVEDGGLREQLIESALADGLTPVTVDDPDQVVAITAASPPSLLLLGRKLRGRDAVELVRSLRRRAEGLAKDLPIVIVTATDAETHRTAGADAGVTDWLVAPFSTLYSRTRIRAWALRQACRWIGAPSTRDEAARLRALRELGILDSGPEERFDRITRLAQRVFDVPIALVSLVDADRQWFKARQGLDLNETHRDLSFCAHAIHDDSVFVVSDALLDPRFAENPAVTGDLRVRFYAGRPLHANGRRVGTLCVVDQRPRHLRDDDVRALDDLAALVERELVAGHNL